MADLEKNLTPINTTYIPQQKGSSEAVKLVEETLPVQQSASDSYVEVQRMTDKGNASVHDLEEAKRFAEIIRNAREHGLDLKYDLIAYALEEGRGSKFVTEVVQEKIVDPGNFVGEIRFHGDRVVVSCADGEIEVKKMTNLLEESRTGLIPLSDQLVKPEEFQNSKLAVVKLIAFDYLPKAIEQQVPPSPDQVMTLPVTEQISTQTVTTSDQVDYSKFIMNAPVNISKDSQN